MLNRLGVAEMTDKPWFGGNGQTVKLQGRDITEHKMTLFEILK